MMRRCLSVNIKHSHFSCLHNYHMRSFRYRQTYTMINNYDHWGSKPISELLGIVGGFSVDCGYSPLLPLGTFRYLNNLTCTAVPLRTLQQFRQLDRECDFLRQKFQPCHFFAFLWKMLVSYLVSYLL